MMTFEEKNKYKNKINKILSKFVYDLKFDDLISFNERYKLILNKIEFNIELTSMDIRFLEILQEYKYYFNK